MALATIERTEIEPASSQFSTERILFRDELADYRAGRWIKVEEEEHQAVVGRVNPQIATVTGREVRGLPQGYEGQKVHFKGNLDLDPKIYRGNRPLWRFGFSPNGEPETIISRVVKVTRLDVIDRPV